METLVMDFLRILIPAIAQGLVALIGGKGVDEALLRTITRLQDSRAKIKFPNLKGDDE